MTEPALTKKQRRFLDALLLSGDPAQAARTAGYATARAEAEGRRLLALPAVAEALRKALYQRSRLIPVTEERVLGELRAIAFSDFTRFIRVEDGTAVVTESGLLDPAQRAAIAGIKDTGKGVEIKLHDKEKALELLVKYLGLFDRAEPEAASLRVVIGGEAEDWSE